MRREGARLRALRKRPSPVQPAWLALRAPQRRRKRGGRLIRNRSWSDLVLAVSRADCDSWRSELSSQCGGLVHVGV